MNAEFVRSLMRHQPFEPFTVIMSNGDIHTVKHPENAFIAGSRFIIYYPENDNVAFCSLLHVNEIRMGEDSEIKK